MKLRTFLSSLACGSLWLALQSSALAAAPSVTLEEARTALEKSTAVVIDVREPSEHAAGVAKGALLIPMGQVESRLPEIAKSKTQPIILVCATQNRSTRLAEKLQAAGYSQISFVQGGMSQWSARGWPLVKP
jgi:rhodanese-related sulfurtransferase